MASFRRRATDVGLRSLGVSWAAILFAAATGWGETPEQIVRKLGSARFEERHAAERKILEIPEDAYAPLKIQAESNDPEVQVRARRLLKVVQRRVLERQFARFAATGNRKFAPLGWDRFSDLAGDSEDSVKLYLSMFLAHPDVLTAFAERSGDLRPAFASLFSDSFSWQQDSRNFPFETFATILYLAASPDCPLDRVTQVQVTNVVNLGQAQSAILHGDYNDQLQRLLGQWVQRPDAGLPESRFDLARRLGLDEALGPALEMVKGAAADRIEHNSRLAEAILLIAEKGTPENVVDLEPLLEVDTKFGEWRQEQGEHITTQIRDTALVASIHLLRQSPPDFGFKWLSRSPKLLYVQNSTGFSSEEARSQAFQKWAHWRKLNGMNLIRIPNEAVEGFSL